MRSAAEPNVDLNSFSNAIRAYIDLNNFVFDKIKNDNSIFKSIEEEAKYLKIPLTAIRNCETERLDIEQMSISKSLSDRISFLKNCQEFLEDFGCTISLH